MVRVVLGLRVVPEGDAADALALAIAHLQHVRLPSGMQ
jgi:Holliday junction resolvasome RuvABC endonuclease subunit